MSLTLYVDGERWRDHLRSAAAAEPDLVPVAKGNGYGFGLHRLARRAGRLGADTVAVGTYHEVQQVAPRFGGRVMVLTPWRPDPAAGAGAAGLADRRLVHTVSRLEDLRRLLDAEPRPRVVLERATSMRRHGMSGPQLRQAGRLLRATDGVSPVGVAMHLPLADPGDPAANRREVAAYLDDVVAAGLASRPVFCSHVPPAELATLRRQWPDLRFCPRVGTDLWLGEPTALRVRATVLDTHTVRAGERFGYRRRRAPRAGTLLIVSGGTSHGVGLEAPGSGGSLWARAVALARGGLDAAGLALSPYTVAGKQRLFAEPPHMQASMLFLPAGVDAPAVGDEVALRARFTTTDFDRVLIR